MEGESDDTVETFVGIVIAETDLQFNGFKELALFASGDQFVDGLLEEVRVNFTH